MERSDNLLRRSLLRGGLYEHAKRSYCIKSWELSGIIVARYYRSLLLQYGVSPHALAERSDLKEQQFYFQLFDNIELPASLSVLDIGCGMGNLIEFLNERGPQTHAYLGIDLVKQFIEVCQRRYQAPYQFLRTNFVSDSLFPEHRFDLVVSMGVMVSRVFQYERYIEYCIRKMIALSSKYVLFNVITELDESLGNYEGQGRVGHVTYIPKHRLMQILGTATRDFNVRYTIKELKIYPDAVDAFVRITVNE
jgi:SAM-dependent methyltransferase